MENGFSLRTDFSTGDRNSKNPKPFRASGPAWIQLAASSPDELFCRPLRFGL